MNAAQHLVLDPLRSARQLIPNARIEIIPVAHYVAAVASPEQVKQKLIEFFAAQHLSTRIMRTIRTTGDFFSGNQYSHNRANRNISGEEIPSMPNFRRVGSGLPMIAMKGEDY